MSFKVVSGLVLRRGYLCCGCSRRFGADDAAYLYNKICLCNECYSKMDKSGRSQCFFGSFNNDYTYSPFYYKGMFRKIFIDFKFGGNRAFGHILGMAAADCLKTVDSLYNFDCIEAVPLSKERYRERGYNQSEIMANYLGSVLKTSVNNVLIRTKHSVPQSLTRGFGRRDNVRDAFCADGDVKGKRIILFDDIHTTGSTLGECAATLYSAGAKEVCFVTASYAYYKEKFLRIL